MAAIFKAGSKYLNIQKNYRPVILTMICKVLEGMLRDSIGKFVGENYIIIIINNQHGFLKGRTFKISVLAFSKEVSSNLDKSKAVNVIYPYFGKALNQNA